MRSMRLTGASRSVSRVPGAEPRTSTPATAPSSPQSTTVQPVAACTSVEWPTIRPATSVSVPFSFTGFSFRSASLAPLPPGSHGCPPQGLGHTLVCRAGR